MSDDHHRPRRALGWMEACGCPRCAARRGRRLARFRRGLEAAMAADVAAVRRIIHGKAGAA